MQVVKEVLRYRPPAPMVPHIAQAPFKLTDGYTAPKGTMIIPSVVAACMQVREDVCLCGLGSMRVCASGSGSMKV